MGDTTNSITEVWPLVLYFGLVIALTAGMLGLSAVLGERHQVRNDIDLPYESGIDSLGSARLRLSVNYYLIALFFVIFDLEAVFIFAWAISLDSAGWPGFIEMSVFIFILLSALIYLWRLGALDWQHAK